MSRLTVTRSSWRHDVPEALGRRGSRARRPGPRPQALEHLVVLEALEAVEVEKVDAFECHVVSPCWCGAVPDVVAVTLWPVINDKQEFRICGGHPRLTGPGHEVTRRGRGAGRRVVVWQIPRGRRTAPVARRGRPLATERTDAILTAAGELFEEVGFDQLTVQDIAQRAGVGLATLYRRWPSKHALLIEALRPAPGAEHPPRSRAGRSRSCARSSTPSPTPRWASRASSCPAWCPPSAPTTSSADTLRDDILDPLRVVIRTQLEADARSGASPDRPARRRGARRCASSGRWCRATPATPNRSWGR